MAPLGRQPNCGFCGHEEHIFFDCEWCLCAAHNPNGAKDDNDRGNWFG